MAMNAGGDRTVARRRPRLAFAATIGVVAAWLGAPFPANGAVRPPEVDTSCAKAEYEAEARAGRASANAADDHRPDLVVVAGDRSRYLNTTRQIAMGQQVTVCIMGLHDWIYHQRKDPSTLRLFVGGTMLAKIPPGAVSPAGQEYVNFVLHMDSADADDWKAWAAVVYASRHSARHQLPISVAVADTKQVFESSQVVTIEQYPRHWLLLVGALVLLLAALLYLAATTDLLRYGAGAPPLRPDRRPLSLGLVQMAWWFFLVIAAYAYICVSTRQIHIPMGSILGLLGISATTAWAAIAVDRQKVATATEVASVARPLPAPRSRGIVHDLLADGDGISFHRFQIAIWTIVLGVVFVWSVYREMSMPEFDASLLSLMGISSGTYVGFKWPEKLKT
jgi:hypothetical protein